MLPLVKEVTRSPDRKMIKLPTLITRFPHFPKIRSRVTTATTFSRENDAGSRASTRST